MQYYYHSDHLGSSSYLTNLDGAVVQHVEYVPFGEVFIEERNNTWNTPYLFNGKELDEETGLYYYGARYYNPRETVWLSVDPLAEFYPDYSPYNYVLLNPVKLIDPTGMGPTDDYVFDENGKFVRIDKKAGEDFLVIENSKTKQQTYYTFNDQKTDVAAIKYNMEKFGSKFKDHTYIYAMTSDWIDFHEKESGIEKMNWFSRNYKALTESNGGKMDPSAYSLPIMLKDAGEGGTWSAKEIFSDKGPLFINQNSGYRVYNYLDEGNWMWGYFMVGIGFNTQEALEGAKKYNSNDTKADLNAIREGGNHKSFIGVGSSKTLPVTNKSIYE